jgi:hypothetical protein
MEKVIVEGKVAVVIHPEYGLGWSSAYPDIPELLFDPGIISLYKEKQWEKLKTYLVLKFPDVAYSYSDRDIKSLVICWVRQGSKFRIEAYDGMESIVLYDDEKWIVA